jgi:hypothetical protein
VIAAAEDAGDAGADVYGDGFGDVGNVEHSMTLTLVVQ